MRARVIGEPELEFRARNRHIDPRYGVAVHGPADADSPSALRDIPVGLVGPAAAIDGMRGWLERCRAPIEAKEAKPGQENLHQSFPGFSTDTSFGAQLVFDNALVRDIPDRQLRMLAKTDVKAAVAEGPTCTPTRPGRSPRPAAAASFCALARRRSASTTANLPRPARTPTAGKSRGSNRGALDLEVWGTSTIQTDQIMTKILTTLRGPDPSASA